MVFLCVQVQSYTSYEWLFWKISVILKSEALHSVKLIMIYVFNKFELSRSDNVLISWSPDSPYSSSQRLVPHKIGFKIWLWTQTEPQEVQLTWMF